METEEKDEMKRASEKFLEPEEVIVGGKKKKVMKKLHKILLISGAALLVLLAGLFLFVYHFHHDWLKGKFSLDKIINNTAKGPVYQFPTYTVLQDGKAKIVAYDYNKKKNYVVLSTDIPGDNSTFSANVSNSVDKIVYTSSDGLSVYDLMANTSQTIFGNVIPQEGDTSTVTVSGSSEPVWSPDGSKIAYKGYGYESSDYNFVDASGQNSQRIDGSGGSLAWTDAANNFTIGYEDEMGGTSGIVVSSAGANGAYKTKNLFPTNPPMVSSLVTTADKIYFIGRTITKDSKGNFTGESDNKIMSINFDGTGLKEILTDKNIFGDLVYNGKDEIYFSKAQYGTTPKGLGTFVMSLDGTVSDFYKDADNFVQVTSANQDNVIISNSPSYYGDPATLKTLSLYTIKDKSVTVLGKSARINFSGWMNSDLIPANAAEIAAPTPTDSEQKAYDMSLKTKGSLYQTYYDYCWDYDCGSATYPYPKLTKSVKPDIISSVEKPKGTLSGKVSVPIVFIYNNVPFTDSELAIMKDKSVAFSYGETENWINQQAANNGEKLTFSFDYKAEQIKIAEDGDCTYISGQSKNFDTNCILKKIIAKYPAVANAPFLIAPFARDYSVVGQNGTGISSTGAAPTPAPAIRVALNTVSATTWASGVSSYTAITDADFSKGLSSNWMNGYDLGFLLQQFGAKDKTASYKTQAAGSTDVCFAGAANDVMCRGYWTADKKEVKRYASLSEIVIGPITAKELGWYDGDGDKVNEADAACPFSNLGNKCN
ncbi:MAG: hypothetical protein NTW50_01915 [Candidatus Berkelbacteria bacterium]|nr:hypothetical protein [Candidatus Berkelbacteria bacterium]